MFLKLTHISFNSKSLGKHVYLSADNISFYSLNSADNTAFTTAISTNWSQSQYYNWPSKMLYPSVHKVPGPRLGQNKGYCEWGFLWSSSAPQSSIISQLYHNYFLPNASAISPLQHKYFPPNASAISQLQHKYFPPNASAISQLQHKYFPPNASAMSPTQQLPPSKCQCHYFNYTTNILFKIPVTSQLHHNYFLTNASVIINYTTTTSIWMPVPYLNNTTTSKWQCHISTIPLLHCK
jgi:hypothetical protein